jgi:hypothetical protein
MIQLRFDRKNFNKTMHNAIEYSLGFLDGAEMGTLAFNTQLAAITEQALKKYIDVKAKANPESLHHVYEWQRAGDPSARLFEIRGVASKNNISFTGEFLPSSSISENSSEPFTDKANIMENKISILVEPMSADALAFEIDGQQVFTVNSVFIENPGGDDVAGSFGRAVDDFFEIYFTTTILKQSGIYEQLGFPKEFSQFFSSGAKIGRSAGRRAGMAYMSIKGDIL